MVTSETVEERKQRRAVTEVLARLGVTAEEYLAAKEEVTDA